MYILLLGLLLGLQPDASCQQHLASMELNKINSNTPKLPEKQITLEFKLQALEPKKVMIFKNTSTYIRAPKKLGNKTKQNGQFRDYRKYKKGF